jgi:hypothetical protein
MGEKKKRIRARVHTRETETNGVISNSRGITKDEFHSVPLLDIFYALFGSFSKEVRKFLRSRDFPRKNSSASAVRATPKIFLLPQRPTCPSTVSVQKKEKNLRQKKLTTKRRHLQKKNHQTRTLRVENSLRTTKQ